MNINFDVMQLGLLFFPGLFARIILGKFLFYRQKTAFDFIVSSFCLGVLSYCFVFVARYALYLLGVRHFPEFIGVPLSVSSGNNAYFINLAEVLYATMASIVVVVAIALAEKNKWIYRLGFALKLTTRVAEPDIWGHAFDSDMHGTSEWATVRNKKLDLMYQGRILAFSDSYKEAEILLSEVVVYKNTEPLFLYTVDMLYLTLDPSDIEIEFYANGGDKNAGNI